MENKMTALDRLKTLKNGWQHSCYSADLAPQRLIDDLETIERLLTPPTSEEVAKAIQKYYGGSVVFKSGEFVLIGYEKPYTLAKLAGGEVKFHSRYSLPPHLIELIGRFYGGLK